MKRSKELKLELKFLTLKKEYNKLPDNIRSQYCNHDLRITPDSLFQKCIRCNMDLEEVVESIQKIIDSNAVEEFKLTITSGNILKTFKEYFCSSYVFKDGRYILYDIDGNFIRELRPSMNEVDIIKIRKAL